MSKRQDSRFSVSSIPSTKHGFHLKTKQNKDSSPPNREVIFLKHSLIFTKHKFWTANSKPEWSGHQKHSRSRDIPKKTKYSVYEVTCTPDIPSPHGIFQLPPGMTLFKSYFRSHRQNLCLLCLYRRPPYLEGTHTSKSSTISLARIPIQGSKRKTPFHIQRKQVRGKDERSLRGGRR